MSPHPSIGMLTGLILFTSCLVQAMTGDTILPYVKVFTEKKMFFTLGLNYCHINVAEAFEVLKIGEDTLNLTGLGTCY